MLFEFILMSALACSSVCLGVTLRNNERLRAMMATSDELIIAGLADIQRLRGLVTEKQRTNGELVEEKRAFMAERDKWQVECAKLRATVERQGGEIVQLQTSLKTAQLSNGVRATNR